MWMASFTTKFWQVVGLMDYDEFKEALELILNVTCYGYYVKGKTLMSDRLFDMLEVCYHNLYGDNAPMRSCEDGTKYDVDVIEVFNKLEQGGRITS